MLTFLTLALVLLLVSSVHPSIAAPASVQSGPVTTLTAAQLADFAPYVQFARAAYCPLSALRDWGCGEACNALPGFQPSLVDGNGNDIQTYIVGFWPSNNTVVVAHQGTDPFKLLSVLTDVSAIFGDLDSSLFPGVPSDVQVHQGFRDEQAKTIGIISEQVNHLLVTTGATSVTCVGHSLGGTLAQLDALYFALHLPSNIDIIATTFGLPRVGNSAYAAFYDTKVPNFQRVNNELDFVPIIPGRGLGYKHPHGEVHILSPGHAVACPGDDDATDRQCQIRSVPSIFEGNLFDHLGPYVGIFIGSIFCT